ncbi:MAG: sensor histidine kinase [Thermoproteota archaeon]
MVYADYCLHENHCKLDVIRGSTDRIAAIREAAKSRPTRFAIVVVALIVGFSLGSSIYYQSINEQNIRAALFEEQRIRQTQNMEGLARQISSELESIAGRLQGIANSNYIQEGELSGNGTSALLAENYLPVRESIGSIFILDKNDIVTAIISTDDQNQVGTSHFGKDYVNDAKTTLSPVLSRSYAGADNTSYVVLSYPVIQRETGEYLGLVAASIPLQQILGGFGSPYITESERVIATDKSGIFVMADDQTLIGKDFQNREILQRLDNPDDFENLFSRAFEGRPSSFVIDGLYQGERLLVAYPVRLREEPVFVIVGSSPTEGTYSKIEGIVFAQRVQTTTLVSAIVASIAVIIYFLARWSETLQGEVKKRTEALEAHDRLQSEFINIAAHELRTPVQPLLGMADILDYSFEQGNAEKIEISKAELNLIRRNARRLERLSSDLLEVSKIESNSLKLHKEWIDLDKKIADAVSDAKSSLRDEKKEKIRIIKDRGGAPISKPLLVYCDKARICQVLSNLIANAIKFTEEGDIVVRCEEKNGHVVVSVIDSGKGIEKEIMPRLFTKFVTRSDSGTGLGLFLSKNIIESHGGSIWAENNINKKGATFAFTLPMAAGYYISDNSDSIPQ